MTDTELLEMLKKKMVGEDGPGSIIGGTGIRYLWGENVLAYYVQEYEVLFISKKPIAYPYDTSKAEIVRDIENFEVAKDYINTL